MAPCSFIETRLVRSSTDDFQLCSHRDFRAELTQLSNLRVAKSILIRLLVLIRAMIAPAIVAHKHCQMERHRGPMHRWGRRKDSFRLQVHWEKCYIAATSMLWEYLWINGRRETVVVNEEYIICVTDFCMLDVDTKERAVKNWRVLMQCSTSTNRFHLRPSMQNWLAFLKKCILIPIF